MGARRGSVQAPHPRIRWDQTPQEIGFKAGREQVNYFELVFKSKTTNIFHLFLEWRASIWLTEREKSSRKSNLRKSWNIFSLLWKRKRLYRRGKCVARFNWLTLSFINETERRLTIKRPTQSNCRHRLMISWSSSKYSTTMIRIRSSWMSTGWISKTYAFSQATCRISSTSSN